MLPRSLVIVGGGYIAAEFAHVFASFGVRVTIVGRSPRLLSREDEQVSERFTQLLGRRVDVRTSTEVRRVDRRPSGDGVRVTVRDGQGSESVVEADLLLVATGRRPNADTLDLATTGVDVQALLQRTPANGHANGAPGGE